MYLDTLADKIRGHVPSEALPEGDTTQLFRLYAVLLLAKGPEVTTEDVHNAWAVWMAPIDPDHESLRPFDELDPDTQSGDEPYVRAIRAASQDTR